MQRRDIQERNNLDGDCATDCLKAWCCACCDLWVMPVEWSSSFLTRHFQDPTRQRGCLSCSQLSSYGRNCSANREGADDCFCNGDRSASSHLIIPWELPVTERWMLSSSVWAVLLTFQLCRIMELSCGVSNGVGTLPCTFLFERWIPKCTWSLLRSNVFYSLSVAFKNYLCVPSSWHLY